MVIIRESRNRETRNRETIAYKTTNHLRLQSHLLFIFRHAYRIGLKKPFDTETKRPSQTPLNRG